MPVLVTFTPPGAASRVTVRLFTGHGAGVYLLFATLAFHVPRELSCPHADKVVVIAKANNARLNIFRISILLVTLRGRFCQCRLWPRAQDSQVSEAAWGNAPQPIERIEDRQSATGTELITGQGRSKRVLFAWCCTAFSNYRLHGWKASALPLAGCPILRFFLAKGGISLPSTRLLETSSAPAKPRPSYWLRNDL